MTVATKTKAQANDTVADTLARGDVTATQYKTALAEVETERKRAADRLDSIRPAAGWNQPGIERQKVIESGSITDLMALDDEAKTLEATIARCSGRRHRLTELHQRADARECAEGLPKRYQAFKHACEAVIAANDALMAAWSAADAALGEAEHSRIRAQKHVRERDLPKADAATLKAAQATWTCCAPAFPPPRVFERAYGRADIAKILGYESATAVGQNMMPPEGKQYIIR